VLAGLPLDHRVGDIVERERDRLPVLGQRPPTTPKEVTAFCVTDGSIRADSVRQV
jgi:hypothetical protein